MSDFSRVHGSNHDPKSLFARENAELRAQVQALNQELMNRAAPTVGNLIDGINNLAVMSQQGNLGARAVLSQLAKALDTARAAASPIAVVKNGS